jgi:hypothetical protein
MSVTSEDYVCGLEQHNTTLASAEFGAEIDLNLAQVLVRRPHVLLARLVPCMTVLCPKRAILRKLTPV